MSMHHTTLRQLAVFEAVARHLSFSRAAAELHLTQPGVSMQVKALEASAGMALFERIGRKPCLTEAGRELLRYALEILRSLDGAEDRLAELKGLRGGRIAIAVVSTAKYFAPQLLARFRRMHPQVEIRLAVSNREVIVGQLAANDVDLAIMGRPPQAPATIAAAFAKHPHVIIAAPDHPLVGRRRLPVDTVAKETFLVREPGSGTRQAMQQFFDERGVKITVGMEMASNETIKQAVIAGMGVAFISRHTVGLELATGKLAVLDVRGLPVVREWHVVHLAAKRLSPAAQMFKSFVLTQGREFLKDYTGAE